MQKQRLILIIGIVLGIIAVFMTKVYIDQQKQAAMEDAKKEVENIRTELQTNQASVLVAKEDIARGSLIEANNFEVKIVPNQYIQPQAVTSLDRISGMVTVALISKGEQITLGKLAYPKQAASSGGLSGATPVGKRAITISVDSITGLVGMIKPGDYVDVIAMIPVPVQTPEGQQATQVAVMPLFQNVLILAVGQETGAPAPMAEERGRYAAPPARAGGDASSMITIALTPQEANLLTFIKEQGKLQLVMRSPADSQIQPVQPAGWDTLFQYLNLIPTAGKQQEESGIIEVEPVQYVEIYRGLNKEKIPLSK